MREAKLYEKLPKKKVRCLACQRKCLIDEGKVGYCLARKNTDGKLYSLIYGITTGIQVDPIEKKPLYHFKPGSLVATIGSFGCNFHCKQCLNSWCTWGKEATRLLTTDYCQLEKNLQKTPKKVAREIIGRGYNGVAFSYNEPVIWAEFCADIAAEFKQTTDYRLQTTADKFTVFVTNGSWTKETIDLLSSPPPPTLDTQLTSHPHPLIDAANIDFKGFSEKTYQKMGAFFGNIPKMAVYAKKKNIFLEITTLVIPTINDNLNEIKEMVNFIVHNLGVDIPWHLSEYDPNLASDREFQKIPSTPPEFLQNIAEIGKNEGLNHVYIWAPHAGFFVSDTTCSKCKKTVIKRSGWTPVEINIKPPNLCQFCGYHLNLIL